ncbi:MAG TPA: helix-turn-helix transcriptional regulator [Rugosimonospora sp.]|nr:helix-turn-helix transcriptional regulator [Rugosimonospora sp.]
MAKIDASTVALGRKIAFHRARRGLSQRDFGAMIDRSETWVSQVERGERRIDRMTVLRQVAEALEVPLAELAADTPIVAEASSKPAPASALRMLLSSSLRLALATAEPSAGDLEALRTRADRAWQLAHAAKYDTLVPILTAVIPDLEATVRAAKGSTRRAAYRILARAYHAAAATLVKLNELGAAWVAADRAISAAEQADDQLLMAEGVFRLTLVFQAGRQYDQAEQAAITGIEALSPLVNAGRVPARSLQGALRLQLAVLAARQNRADEAREQLRQARAAADGLDGDRNDFDTEFGPTNVTLHEVAVAVELGDAGTALRVFAGVDMSRLSPERRGRVLIDVARAHLQRRHPEGAISALVEAERLTPEQVHSHWMVRALLQDLERAGHAKDPRVRGLLDRARFTSPSPKPH